MYGTFPLLTEPSMSGQLTIPRIRPKFLGRRVSVAECTVVAAIQLRMRMRILMRPKNSIANFSHQISHEKLRIKRCEGIR